jgi:hypothetical protein
MKWFQKKKPLIIEELEIIDHLIMVDFISLSGEYKNVNININQYYERVSHKRNIKINKLLK